MKWAVIGLGGAGLQHAERVVEVDGLELAGGYDPLPEANKKFEAELGVPAYESLEALLADDSVEAVVIATASGVHAELTTRALEAGKHVLVEKPFATGAADAQRMIDVARKTGKIVAPFHNRRFDPDYLMVREVLASGRLGLVRRIYSSFGSTNPSKGWRRFKDSGGGRLYDWGPHLIDQVLALVGSPITDVAGVMYPFAAGEGDADEYFRTDLRFADGPSVTVESCGFTYIRPTRWVIYGEDATLELTGNIHGEFTMSVCPAGGEPESTTTTMLAERETRGQGPVIVYEHFRDCILGTGDLAVPPEDAVRVATVIDAVIRSADEGRSVQP